MDLRANKTKEKTTERGGSPYRGWSCSRGWLWWPRWEGGAGGELRWGGVGAGEGWGRGRWRLLGGEGRREGGSLQVGEVEEEKLLAAGDGECSEVEGWWRRGAGGWPAGWGVGGGVAEGVGSSWRWGGVQGGGEVELLWVSSSSLVANSGEGCAS